MNTDAASPEFVRAFEARADAGVLRFDAFMDLALYDPEVGYYTRSRPRVGYGAGTDFYTASTSGPVFGELVAAACTKLLHTLHGASDANDPHEYTFVEIGAESAGGVLAGVAHPFKMLHTIRVGDLLELSGPCVVFSNELFDAQPFRRFRRERGQWRELGVALRAGALAEIVLPDPCSSVEYLPGRRYDLPAAVADGYTIDAPIAAARLADIICRPAWAGLFVAFDYGKTWRELAEACPAGTSRAFYRHTQTNDLLARPGEQDLTCHICWDWLSEALSQRRFGDVQMQTQESFFVRHAEAYLQKAIMEDAARLTARKQSLMQLLHGSHLGQKFQVLSGFRTV